MNMIKMPGFTAEQSLQSMRGRYRSGQPVALSLDGVIPAIPSCDNCDFILNKCENNGWKPRAACNACNSGNCSSGEENPGGHCRYDHASGDVICDF